MYIMKNFLRIIFIIVLLTLFVPPLAYWCWVATVQISETHDLKRTSISVESIVKNIRNHSSEIVIFGISKRIKENKSGDLKYVISNLEGDEAELPKDLIMLNTSNTKQIQFLVFRKSRYRNFSAQSISGNKEKIPMNIRLQRQFKAFIGQNQQRIPIGAIVIDQNRVLSYPFPLHKLITQAYYIPGEFPESIIVRTANQPIIERLKLKESAYVNTSFTVGNDINWVMPIDSRVILKSNQNFFALDQRSGTVNQLKDFNRLLKEIQEPPKVFNIPGKPREQLLIANTIIKSKDNKEHLPYAKSVIYDIQGDFGYTSNIQWPGYLRILGKSKIPGIYFAIGNLNIKELLKRNNRKHPNYLLELDINTMKLKKLVPFPINMGFDPNSIFLEKQQLMLLSTSDSKEFRVISVPDIVVRKINFQIPKGYKLIEWQLLP